MQFYVLIAQRKESYPGEYALEDLGSATEHDADNNGEYMPDTEEKAHDSGDFDRLAWITVEMEEDALLAKITKPEAITWRDTPRPEGKLVIRCLFTQPKCDYPGQYGLTVFDSMDEYGVDSNPDYLINKLKEAQDSNDYSALGFVDIAIDEQEIRSILCPERKALPVTVY